MNAALASGNARQIDALKDLLQGYNELGSDLDANGRVPSSALAPLNGALVADGHEFRARLRRRTAENGSARA